MNLHLLFKGVLAARRPEKRAAWVEKTAGVWNAFAPQVGPELLERVRGHGRG